MKILIVYAYPNDEGYQSALLKTVENSLSGRHETKLVDLYQEEFDPVLYFNKKRRRRDLQFDSEMEMYREMVEWANHLIIIFPIWWSGMPAILKGFIDKVFAKGFAYSYKGLLPIGHLKGKSATIFTTHDTPRIYVSLAQEDYGKVLKKQILTMCGVKPVKLYSFSYLRGKSLKQRERYLTKVQSICKKI